MKKSITDLPNCEPGEYEPPPWQAKVYGSGGFTQAPRKRPATQTQDEILDEQDHRCLYCGLPFGTVVVRRGIPSLLSVEWDHYVPYSYQYGNRGLVAACDVCNAIKHATQFESLEEARAAIKLRWKKLGYRTVS